MIVTRDDVLRGLGDTSTDLVNVQNPNTDGTADALTTALTAGVTAYDSQVVQTNITPWLFVAAFILLFSMNSP